MSFKGKIVAITGAAGGIGQSLCRYFVAEGAAIAAIDKNPALNDFAKALGLEYAGQAVRVNALAPGYVRTQKVVDYWNSFPDPVAAEAETMKLHPGGRIATPEEIAKAALFMISDECPFMNATCLTVDGGMSVLHHP